MGTGRINNIKYYEGFEEICEPSIVFIPPDESMEILHIWDGYFHDIFDTPPMDGKGWHGFTRDYNQDEGPFGIPEIPKVTNLREYLDDMKLYENKVFRFEETIEVYELLRNWLKEAIEKGCEYIEVEVF